MMEIGLVVKVEGKRGRYKIMKDAIGSKEHVVATKGYMPVE